MDGKKKGMSLVRNSAMRSGDYLEGMISDNVDAKAKSRAHKSTSARLVTFLTSPIYYLPQGIKLIFTIQFLCMLKCKFEEIEF